MRRFVITSFVGHLVVLLVGGILAETLHTPVALPTSLDVALVSPVEASTLDEIPPPPADLERPEAATTPDDVPPEAPDPVVEPEMPETTLPPPPEPEELVRPERDVIPDEIPADAETREETPDLVAPDPELPPPPPIEDLPEPPPVQPRGSTERASTDTAPPDETTPTPTPPVAAPASEDVEEIDEGEFVGAQSDSGVDDSYLKRVRRKIGRLWQPTPASTLGQARVVTIVSFRIRIDGQIQSPRVTEPSGLTVFDREALRAVIDASPLPELPPRFGDGIVVNFRFEYLR